MGPNGALKTHLRGVGNTTANKIYRVYLGSSVVGSIGALTTIPNFEFLMATANQGSESLQINCRPSGTTGVGSNGATFSATSETSAVDTSVDQVFSISMQNSTNAACSVLLHADTTVTYGA